METPLRRAQARERAVKFPALPSSVRAQVAPFVASDLSLWRHARALLYQRAYGGLLAPHDCAPSRMLDNKPNLQSCGSAVSASERERCHAIAAPAKQSALFSWRSRASL